MLESLIQLSIRRRFAVMLVFLAMCLASLPGLLRLQQDNAPENFFVRDAVAIQQYADFEFEFGRDRTLRVAFQGEAVWSREGLEWIADFEQHVVKLRGVIGAAGLFGHHGFRMPDWPPAEPLVFRNEVLSDPLDRNAAWVNDDGSTVTVIVALYRLKPADQRIALQQIEQLLGTAPIGIRTSMAGLPVVNQAMDKALSDMVGRFFPILLLLAIVLLVLGLRRWDQIMAPLLLVFVSLVTPLGLMGYLGISFNLVLVVLVPLIFVISLATAVHVLIYFRRLSRRGLAVPQTILATYRVKAWPVIWTGITTGAGFGSLMVSLVPPIQILGLWSLLSIVIMTFAMLTLYPALLAGLKTSQDITGWEQRGQHLGQSWALWSVNHQRAVFTLFALVGIGLLAGATRLNIESNVLTYFKAGHPMRTDLQLLENAGIGVIGAELVLMMAGDEKLTPADDRRRFDRAEELNRLSELSAGIRALDRVLGGISAGDLVQGVSRYRTSGDFQSENALSSALEAMHANPGQQQMLNYFLSADASKARISLLVPMLGYTELEPLFEQARKLARQQYPEAGVILTGQYPLVLGAQKTLLRTMLLSLSITLLCIALIFRLVLGSSQLMLRALTPNLWPVLFVLGIMGWSGIPVDSPTVMIAAAILGLAVDDTLHSLGSFRQLVETRTGAEAAVMTLDRTAAAHVLTSLILAAGFAVVGRSEFLPVARFGDLSALAILAALAADLILVPALLAASPQRALEKLPAAGGSSSADDGSG